MQAAESNNWWHDFFDELFFLFYPDEHSTQTIQFLIKQLALQPQNQILDLCCGKGSIAIPLAKLGYSVTALDFSKTALKLAKQIQKRTQCSVEWVQDDARTTKLNKTFDAVINWQTSFGYIKDDEENLKILKTAYNHLKTDGRFALDFMNADRLKKNYESKIYFKKEIKNQKYKVQRNCTIDFSSNLFLQNWIFSTEGKKEISRETSIKLYSSEELKNLFLQAGFSKIVFFGDDNESPYSSTSERCIAIAQK